MPDLRHDKQLKRRHSALLEPMGVIREVMFWRKTSNTDLPQFAGMPVNSICVGHADRMLAVHIHGDLRQSQMPIVCLPGYVRNMLDFSELPTGLGRGTAPVPPLVMIDLAGRGRSAPLPAKVPYSTLSDAQDALAVLDALGIARAVICGQGHGGQVAMVMARDRPRLFGGTILIDAGPAVDPRGLVRLRNNLRHITGLKDSRLVSADLRKILLTDYPDANETKLEKLIERLFRLDSRGRAHGLYDDRLVSQLEHLSFDDVLEPQWALFDCLSHAPMLLMRSQFGDTLRGSTFDEMARRRQDARTLVIEGRGSPALLETAQELDAIASFAADCEPPTSEADD
ncbi:alpha/beta fold hydrolase [Pelagibacterium lentulum]|nr:alpha/beta hydrolase [Pelagibacterium lentulum]